jgi:TolA-binding protein
MYAQKKQYRAALSTLERLEHGYPDTTQCRKSQKIALIILPRYDEKLQKLLGNVDTLMEKRNRALDGMNFSDRNRTKKIFDYEDRRYQNLLNLATANGKRTKWLPISKYFKEPIENNLKLVHNEIKRINIASQKPTMKVGKLYRETYSALEDGDYQLAKGSFDQFKRAKPPEELVNELELRLQDAKSVMERMIIQKREEEKIAKKKAIEEKSRLAKEKRDIKKNKGKN